MSETNSKSEMSPEMKKKILLGLLGVILIGVIAYQFWPSSSSAGNNVNRPPQIATVTSTPKASAVPLGLRPNATLEPIVSQPLNLASISDRTVSGATVGRNIFIYPTPTPIPPPKPTPIPPTPIPPPINLYSLNPGGVLARTGDFDMTLYGEKIPADGRVYIDGREYSPASINPKEIRVRVSADSIRNAGNLNIQVRSVGDATLFSNQLSLNVAEPPPPPYRYIGLIIKKSGATIAVLKSLSNDDVINVSKDTRFGQWRVISITPQNIVVEDTSNKVTHSIKYSGENG